ncbi:MAG: hypothetical protein U9N55_09980 [candidate division Zixibacteria bacterium]|nr:hypothetical protein [candidate division Zixibacteria bacterium]
MSKWKRIVSAVMLTALLTGVVVADGLVLIGDNNSYEEAGFFNRIRLVAAQYDSEGNLIGCSGPGSNCAIIALSSGIEVTISLEGIHTQH